MGLFSIEHSKAAYRADIAAYAALGASLIAGPRRSRGKAFAIAQTHVRAATTKITSPRLSQRPIEGKPCHRSTALAF